MIGIGKDKIMTKDKARELLEDYDKDKQTRGQVIEMPEGETAGFYCPGLGREVRSCGYDTTAIGEHRSLCVGAVCARAVVAMALGIEQLSAEDVDNSMALGNVVNDKRNVYYIDVGDVLSGDHPRIMKEAKRMGKPLPSIDECSCLCHKPGVFAWHEGSCCTSTGIKTPKRED